MQTDISKQISNLLSTTQLTDIPDTMISMPGIHMQLQDYVMYSLYLEQLQHAENLTISDSFIESIERVVSKLRAQLKTIGTRLFVHFDNSVLDEVRCKLIKRTPSGKQHFLRKIPFSRIADVPGSKIRLN